MVMGGFGPGDDDTGFWAFGSTFNIATAALPTGRIPGGVMKKKARAVTGGGPLGVSRRCERCVGRSPRCSAHDGTESE